MGVVRNVMNGHYYLYDELQRQLKSIDKKNLKKPLKESLNKRW